jgi:hypothetical protein
MAPKCKAPKCANVKAKCQCPNAWTEFVSRNAADRKARGLKPATRQEHAAAYRAQKAVGGFDPKPGMNNAPCKTDAVKLCAWNARRKIAGRKDLPAALLERRAEKIVGREIAGRKTAAKTDVEQVRAFCKDKLGLPQSEVAGKTEEELFEIVTRELGLDKKHVRITGFLGSGYFGRVFKAKYNGSDVAVKMIDVEAGSDNTGFDRETHMHRLMHKKLPVRVPKHYDAFCVKKRDVRFNITVMELLNIDLYSVYLKNEQDGKFVRHVARQLKDIVEQLRANKLVHNDLHPGNLGYKLHRGLPKLYLIDFGMSYGGVVSDVDIAFSWLSPYLGVGMNGGDAILKAFNLIKFPGSFIVNETIGVDRIVDPAIEYEELDHDYDHDHIFQHYADLESKKYWDKVSPAKIRC